MRKLCIGTGLVLFLVAQGAVLAQQQQQYGQQDPAATAAGPAGVAAGSTAPTAVPATAGPRPDAADARGQVRPLSDIIGANVETPGGDSLGSIRDVAIDERDGSIVYAVLAKGGFLGIGRDFYAVPWEAFQLDHRARRVQFTLNIPEAQFDRIEGFDDQNWPAQPDHRLVAGRQERGERERLELQRRESRDEPRQREAWELERRDRFDQPREQYRLEVERRDRDQTQQWQRDQDQTQQWQRDQGQTQQWQRDRQAQDRDPQRDRFQVERRDRWEDRDRTEWRDDLRRDDDTTWRGRRDARRTPAGIVRGSSVLGYDVINPRGEDLGRVDDVMVELETGQIAYVVMAAGGFLRIGEDYFPLSWENVRVREQQRALVANIDSRQLEQAEGYDRRQLIDIRDARQARRYQEMPILGEPVGPQHRPARPGQAEADRRYQQKFDEDRIHAIRGQITSVTEVAPMPQASRILVLRVRSEDDRTYNVHLGPTHFIEQRALNLRTGTQVEVRGSWAEVQDENVLMATELRADRETLRLRERDGRPLWERQERGRAWERERFQQDRGQQDRFQQDRGRQDRFQQDHDR